MPARFVTKVGVAWVGAADMGTDRAALPPTVFALVAKIVERAFARASAIRKAYQRRAVVPPAHHLGCQPMFVLRALRRLFLEEVPEADHVLLELAEHHVGAVLTQRHVCMHLITEDVIV